MKAINFAHQIEWAIGNSALLSLLRPLEQKQLAAESSLFEIGKGEALYRSGDAADSAWAVVKGQIKIMNQSHTGHRLLIEIMTAGEICGADFYSENAHFTFSAFAMEGTTTLRFPNATLRKFTDSNPRFLRGLAEELCRRLYHAQHMRSLSIENVAGRIACALVYLQDKFGNQIPHGRATLAELAGTTVESAIRATKSLREKGILETRRNKIEIRSLHALKDFAHKPSRAEQGG
jgi:CRP-like cAMP-binding protein